MPVLKTEVPRFERGENTAQRVEAVVNYLNQLQDNLNYVLQLLQTNRDVGKALEKYVTIDESEAGIRIAVRDISDTLRAELKITADGLEAEVTRATGAESSLSSRITQTADAITAEVDRATGAESGLSTRITQNAEAIDLKASQTSVDDLSGRVTDAEAELTVQAGQISAKASQTLVDNLAGRVTDAETELTMQAAAIAFKVEQTEFDALEGRVDTAESNITLTANAITAEVTRATAAESGLGTRLTSAEQKITDEAIVSTVKSGMTFGGRNLLLKTDRVISKTFAGGTNKDFGDDLLFSAYFYASRASGKEFTVSFDWETDATSGTIHPQGNNTPWHLIGQLGGDYDIVVSSGNQSGHYEWTGKMTAASVASTATYTGLRLRVDNLTGTVTIRNVKFEWSGAATDWTPAPEDAAEDAMDSARAANVIPYPYYHTSRTVNGVTWTVNEDGSVTADGTASANSEISLIHETASGFKLTAGTYTLSGCPGGGGNTAYGIFIYHLPSGGSNTSYGWDYGGTKTFTVSSAAEDDGIGMRLWIWAGKTVSNLTFWPMLEKGETAHGWKSPALTSLPSRVASAESSITQQAGEIALKVSQTDYNGETIASRINQSADTVQIQAKHVVLDGYAEFTNADDDAYGENLLEASDLQCYNNNAYETLTKTNYATSRTVTYEKASRANLGFFPNAFSKMEAGTRYCLSFDVRLTSGTCTSFLFYVTRNTGTWYDQDNIIVEIDGTSHKWAGNADDKRIRMDLTDGEWHRFRIFTATLPTMSYSGSSSWTGDILQFNKVASDGGPCVLELRRLRWGKMGATIVNGDEILTGTVKADRLDVEGIFAKDITATGTIRGAELIAPDIKGNEIILEPDDTTDETGGLTIRGAWSSVLYDMLRIAYEINGGVPFVNFDSPAGGYAWWDFAQTIINGYMTLVGGKIQIDSSATLDLNGAMLQGFGDRVTSWDYSGGSTSGTWRWRKWASGLAECWGFYDVANVPCTTAAGSMYVTAAINPNVAFPSGLFDSNYVPQMQMTFNSANGTPAIVWADTANTPTSGMNSFKLMRQASTAAINGRMHYYYTGRWK